MLYSNYFNETIDFINGVKNAMGKRAKLGPAYEQQMLRVLKWILFQTVY